MEENKAPRRNISAFGIGILLVFCLLFWLMVLNTDVYAFAVVGAVYEILWLPMLILPAILPVILLVLWGRQKFRLNSPYGWLLLTSVGLLIFMLTRTL